MARGVPITPEQTEAILVDYRRTGNATETARIHGISDYAVRLAKARVGESDRNALHALACARSVRIARTVLSEMLATMRARAKRLATDDERDPVPESRAAVEIARELRGQLDSIVKREKAQAETEAIQRGGAERGYEHERLVVELPDESVEGTAVETDTPAG